MSTIGADRFRFFNYLVWAVVFIALAIAAASFIASLPVKRPDLWDRGYGWELGYILIFLAVATYHAWRARSVLRSIRNAEAEIARARDHALLNARHWRRSAEWTSLTKFDTFPGIDILQQADKIEIRATPLIVSPFLNFQRYPVEHLFYSACIGFGVYRLLYVPTPPERDLTIEAIIWLFFFLMIAGLAASRFAVLAANDAVTMRGVFLLGYVFVTTTQPNPSTWKNTPLLHLKRDVPIEFSTEPFTNDPRDIRRSVVVRTPTEKIIMARAMKEEHANAVVYLLNLARHEKLAPQAHPDQTVPITPTADRDL